MNLNENMPSPQNYENRQMSKNINNVTNDKNNIRNCIIIIWLNLGFIY